MRPIIVVALAAAAGLLAGQFYATAAPSPKPPDLVEVTNFPDPQTVAGSVSVTNLPAVQDVNVTNDPLIVTGVMPVRFQLVAFSTQTRIGNAGFLGLSSACSTEFAGSRMCNSREVIQSIPIPIGTGDAAWVSLSAIEQIGGLSGTTDASGINGTIDTLGCGRAGGPNAMWTEDSSIFFGLTVDGAGRFVSGGCDVSRPVACCALAP